MIIASPVDSIRSPVVFDTYYLTRQATEKANQDSGEWLASAICAMMERERVPLPSCLNQHSLCSLIGFDSCLAVRPMQVTPRVHLNLWVITDGVNKGGHSCSCYEVRETYQTQGWFWGLCRWPSLWYWGLRWFCPLRCPFQRELKDERLINSWCYHELSPLGPVYFE